MRILAPRRLDAGRRQVLGDCSDAGGRPGSWARLRQPVDGEVAEWSNAAVLKTVEPKGSGGSNPSLSANVRSLTAAFDIRTEAFATLFPTA